MTGDETSAEAAAEMPSLTLALLRKHCMSPACRSVVPFCCLLRDFFSNPLAFAGVLACARVWPPAITYRHLSRPSVSAQYSHRITRVAGTSTRNQECEGRAGNKSFLGKTNAQIGGHGSLPWKHVQSHPSHAMLLYVFIQVFQPVDQDDIISYLS